MSYKNIVLALCGRGDEGKVIKEAFNLKDQLNADLSIVHVNDPHAGEMSMMMDSPKIITEDDIKERLVVNGFEKEADSILIRIVEGENVAKVIKEAASGANMLILGHRKRSAFKDQFFDSVDEGIVNRVECPVVVVPKD